MSRIKLYEEFSNFINKKIYDSPEFNRILEEAIEPSSFICSFVASAIKMLEGDAIKIYGFSYEENPSSVYFSPEELQEGHHFAVYNDRLIIDPWVFEGYNRSVFDLNSQKDKDIIEYIYGDKNNWTDITKYSDNFKNLFPNTYQDLIDFHNKYTRKDI